MAVLRIPTSTSSEVPNYRQRTTLDGRQYVLRFRWNVRGAYWTIDVHDSSDNPIASGVKVVPGWDLLKLVTDPRKPPGVLMAVDMTGDGEAPGIEQLGRDVVLYYFDEDEVDAAQDSAVS
ncbi:MAG: phage baseplate plug family protein [Myxococcota bacterium]